MLFVACMNSNAEGNLLNSQVIETLNAQRIPT
jgi:hypothetical protein